MGIFQQRSISSAAATARHQPTVVAGSHRRPEPNDQGIVGSKQEVLRGRSKHERDVKQAVLFDYHEKSKHLYR